MAPEMLCRSPSGSELEPGPPILGRAGGNCSRRRGQPAPRAQPSNPTAFHACLTQEQTLNCKTGSGPWLFFFFFPPFFTILLKRIHKEKGKKKIEQGRSSHSWAKQVATAAPSQLLGAEGRPRGHAALLCPCPGPQRVVPKHRRETRTRSAVSRPVNCHRHRRAGRGTRLHYFFFLIPA